MSASELHNQAQNAARNAAEEHLRKNPGWDACGFAWVTIYGVKLSTKLGKELKALGFRKEYGGGISLWNPSGVMTQNMSALEAGAQAYAKVFRDAGYQAYSQSRMD